MLRYTASKPVRSMSKGTSAVEAGRLGLIGRHDWHDSDGLHGTVPGAKNGENRPEWRPEVSFGVVRCHLAGGVAPTRSCGGGNQPLSPPAPRPGSAAGRGNVDHARRHAVPPAMATRSSRIVLCPRASVDAPDTLGKILGPERFQQLRELSPVPVEPSWVI